MKGSEDVPQEKLSFAQTLKRGMNILHEVVSDLPEAVYREYDYRVWKRRSALLIPTWRCTSRCRSCTAWRRPAHPESELTVDQWMKIARQLVERGVRSFEIFGGDALLRKDVVFPMVRYLHEAGCYTHMPTNCNLLDQLTARELADGLCYIYLSLDGLAHKQDAIRGSEGSFTRVERALRMLIEARGYRPTPNIICNTSVSRENVDQIEAMARYTQQAGFDRVHFEYVGQFEQDHVDRSCIGREFPTPLFLRQGPSLLITREQTPVLREQLCRAHQLARAKTPQGRPFIVTTTNIDVLSDQDLIEGTVPKRRCFPMRNLLVIDPVGRIAPCLFYDQFGVGNALNGGLTGKFNTRRQRLFEHYRDSGRIALCRHCIQSVARNRTAWDVLRRAVLEGMQRPA